MSIHSTLTDAIYMIENELVYIKTGRSNGPVMRDCRGQWEAVLREMKQELAAIKGAA